MLIKHLAASKNVYIVHSTFPFVSLMYILFHRNDLTWRKYIEIPTILGLLPGLSTKKTLLYVLGLCSCNIPHFIQMLSPIFAGL